MKVSRMKNHGVKPSAVTRAFFLTSSLVSLLKRVMAEVVEPMAQPAPKPVLVRVKR